MIIAQIITWISMIVFGAAAIRQLRGSLSAFFILLGLADPINQLIRICIKVAPIQVFLAFAILSFFSLCDKKDLKKSLLKASLIILIIIPMSYYLELEILCLIFICVQIMILFKFIKMFSLKIIREKEVNLFYTLIILYTITLIAKFFVVLTKTYTGIIFFYLTSTFELFIGLFYIFFTEDNEKIRFRLTDNH